MEQMTTTTPTLIEEIEAFLSLTAHRHMIEASEIQDFLLDLRNRVADANLN